MDCVKTMQKKDDAEKGEGGTNQRPAQLAAHTTLLLLKNVQL